MAKWNEKLQTAFMYQRKVSSYIREHGLGTTLQKVTSRLKTKADMLRSHESDPRVTDIYKELLAAYDNGAIRGIAVISSGMEFDEVYNQRTINFAKYLSEHQYGVLYVTWQYDTSEEHQNSFRQAYPNLYQIPLYPYLYTLAELQLFQAVPDKLFISTFPAKAFYSTLPQLKEQGFRVIYDIMDEWEEFFKTGDASWYQRSVEDEFVRDADIVSAVSVPLQQKFAHIRTDIILSGNGYHEKVSKHPNIARKMKDDGKIHLGYFGHMTSSWFDWELMFRLAERDNIELHFVGHGASEATLERIAAAPNMHFYGKVHPSELHTYVRQWHIGLIPFKESKLSEAVDPIKIYEYLYFGLPTISTGIPHIGNYPCVHHCNTHEQVLAKVDEVYANLDQTEQPELQAFLQTTTWDKQFDKVMRVLA